MNHSHKQNLRSNSRDNDFSDEERFEKFYPPYKQETQVTVGDDSPVEPHGDDLDLQFNLQESAENTSYAEQQYNKNDRYYAVSALTDGIPGKSDIKPPPETQILTDRPVPLFRAISFKFDWSAPFDIEYSNSVHVHMVGSADHRVRLVDAIHNSDVDTCRDLLLKKKLNPNFNVQMISPICRAAAMGNVEILNLLLDAGADPNTPNSDDLLWERRPIHIAASKGHLSALQILVQRGAHINQHDSDHRTPLHWVAMYGQAHMIRWMIEAGASVNATQTDGFTPLHTASCLGHKDVCRLLVEEGADIMSQLDHDGWTPLHTAVCYGYIEIVQLFLDKGANPCDVTVSQLDSTLHIACSKGNVDIINLLLKRGVPIEGTNIYGATPLHTAVYYNQGYAAYHLIKAGANVNAKNLSGKSPVYQAAVHCEMQTLQSLIKAGGQVTKDVPVPLDNNIEVDVQPPTLKLFCLLVIRQAMAPNLQDNAALLPIPDSLKRSLTMQDMNFRVSDRHGCPTVVAPDPDVITSDDLNALIWMSNIS